MLTVVGGHIVHDTGALTVALRSLIGVRVVSPRMYRRLSAMALTALLVTPTARGQQPPAPVSPTPDGTAVPRTADGRPDLSGVWNKRLVLNTAASAEPLPFTAEGLKAFNDVWNHIDPTSKCVFPGVPLGIKIPSITPGLGWLLLKNTI